MQLASTLKRLDFACEASGPLDIQDIGDLRGRIRDGKFIVPDGPGYGVEIDEDLLSYYTADSWKIDESCSVQD